VYRDLPRTHCSMTDLLHAVPTCNEVPTNIYCISCGTTGDSLVCVAGNGTSCMVSGSYTYPFIAPGLHGLL